MARSEVEEIILLLIFLTLIAVSSAVMIKLSSSFLGHLGVVARRVSNFVSELV